MHHIAIFGGTFDPIHNGHLQTSLTIQSHFKFDRYIFLPCKTPTIKPPAFASDLQRVKMIELAISAYPNFTLDLREIKRDSPSYTVETLQSFRTELPDSSITLIIGYDAFLSLPQWHQWEKLITLANILVIYRNEYSKQKIPIIMHKFLNNHQHTEEKTLLTNRAGVVFLFNAGHYEISSTAIREAIKKKKDISSQVSREIYQYIKVEGLYQ